MLAFMARRLAVSIPTLLLISLLVFSLQLLLPGDPALAIAGEERRPEVLAFIREKYHLNDPIVGPVLVLADQRAVGRHGDLHPQPDAGDGADPDRSCRSRFSLASWR